jgi:hypothetical protein
MIAHKNQRGAAISAAQEARFFERMRAAFDAEQAAYRSMSGAEVAGAPLHGYERHFYQLCWEGVEVEAALALCDAEWRAYAAENNARVAAAPKLKHSGLSSIDHRWCSPERFQTSAIHLRHMAAKILSTDPLTSV